MTYALRRLDESDAEAAGEVFTRAFLSTEGFRYVMPSLDDQRRLFPQYFTAYTRLALHGGEVWGVDAEPGVLAGAIYWYRVPEDAMTPEQSREWGIDACNAAWGAANDRLAADERLVHAVMNERMPEPRRNIGVLGVDPARQGRGVGSALLHHVFQQAKTAGIPIATWTSTETRNVPFYRRAGLEIVAEGIFPESGLPWWAFLTPPAAD